MSEDMVKRVALALYESGCIRSDDMLNHLARAAIEAMREPTNQMVAYGSDGGSGDYVTSWRLMIDAALKEATQ